MTVVISIGRRVPQKWFRRQVAKAKGIISFQEHIWLIIKQSMQMAKRKASADGRLTFVITMEKEKEDMYYFIEWLKVTIQGTEEQEAEEHEEAMAMYSSLGQVLKKELPDNAQMKKHFKTKILTTSKVKEAYEKGYGASTNENISNKLLEMGILTHIEWHKDFDNRDVVLES